MNAFQPATPNQVRERYKQEWDLLTSVLEAMSTLGQQLDGRPMGGMSRIQFFVLFQFIKAFKTSQAVYRLFFEGFAEDAEMLLRVLIEQAILVRWTHKEDSDERVRAYALYLGEKQFKLLEQIRAIMPETDLSNVPIEDIEKGHKEYGQLEKQLKWRSLTGDTPGLAAEVGMNSSYMFHMGGTDLIHSNPTRERDYVRNAQDGTFFNSTACMPDSGVMPIICAQHLLFVADIFNDVFVLGADEELRALMESVQQTRPSDKPDD